MVVAVSGMWLRGVATSGAPRRPKATFVGKIGHGFGLAGYFTAQGVERVIPTGGGEIFEDFAPIWQMHEGSARCILEIAVAEFEEARILFTFGPAECFEAPKRLFGRAGIAVVGSENQRRARMADGVKLAQGGAAVFTSGDLHEPIEHEECAAETVWRYEEFVIFCMARVTEPGGIGVVETNGGGASFGGEAAGLFDKLLGEIEGSEVLVAFMPESEGYTAGAAAGFEEGGVFVGKETFDQKLFGFPESQEMRGARVVNDGDGIVEVGADGGGGNFLNRRQQVGVT